MVLLIAAMPLGAQIGSGYDSLGTAARQRPGDAGGLSSFPVAGPGGYAAEQLHLPLERGMVPTFGPIGCPVFVVGDSVIELRSFQTIEHLEGSYVPRGRRVLSREGNYFVATDNTPNRTDTTVTVWCTQTGRQVLQVPGSEKAFVDPRLVQAHTERLARGGRAPRC